MSDYAETDAMSTPAPVDDDEPMSPPPHGAEESQREQLDDDVWED